jgi:Family of unknown function (DUF6308)
MDCERGLGRIDDIVRHPSTRRLVAEYFDESSPFEGNLLERIGNNDPFRITLDDLLAVTMLDVEVKPRGVRRVLFDKEFGAASTELLKSIPGDVDIWDRPDLVAAGGEAGTLWELLRKERGHGIGSVTAGKLLSRKRPRLIPIVDSVVKKIIDVEEGSQWEFFATCLEDAERRDRIVKMEPSGLEPSVSTLRLLDVALWMWGSAGRPAKKARERAELAEPERREILGM